MWWYWVNFFKVAYVVPPNCNRLSKRKFCRSCGSGNICFMVLIISASPWSHAADSLLHRKHDRSVCTWNFCDDSVSEIGISFTRFTDLYLIQSLALVLLCHSLVWTLTMLGSSDSVLPSLISIPHVPTPVRVAESAEIQSGWPTRTSCAGCHHLYCNYIRQFQLTRQLSRIAWHEHEGASLSISATSTSRKKKYAHICILHSSLPNNKSGLRDLQKFVAQTMTNNYDYRF